MVQKFRGRELVVNGTKIRHETQPAFQFLRFVRQFMSIHLYRATRAFLQPGNRAHRRRFSRSIRADQTAYVAGFNGQGKVVDRHDPGKINPQCSMVSTGLGMPRLLSFLQE